MIGRLLSRSQWRQLVSTLRCGLLKRTKPAPVDDKAVNEQQPQRTYQKVVSAGLKKKAGTSQQPPQQTEEELVYHDPIPIKQSFSSKFSKKDEGQLYTAKFPKSDEGIIQTEEEQQPLVVAAFIQASLQGYNSINLRLSKKFQAQYEVKSEFSEALWWTIDHVYSNFNSNLIPLEIRNSMFELQAKYRIASRAIEIIGRFPRLDEVALGRINKLISFYAELCFQQISLTLKNYPDQKKEITMLAILSELRSLFTFLQSTDPLLLYKLTFIYEYLIVKRKNKKFFTDEIHAILCLYTKITDCKNLSELSLHKLTIILYFFSKYSKNLSSVVSGELHKLVMQVTKAYPNWYQSTNAAKSIFHSIAKDTVMNTQLRQTFAKAFDHSKTLKDPKDKYVYISNLLKTSLYLRLIDAKTIFQKYPHIIEAITSDCARYQECVLTFCRAELWIPEFWECFLKGMASKEPFLQEDAMFANFVIWTINKLQKEIPSATYSRLAVIIHGSEKLKSLIELSQKEVSEYYKKEFHNERVNEMNFYQLSINTCLKKLGIPSKFETHIGPFNVDILINNYVILETNGPDHYVLNQQDQSLTPTLNSHFKTKMLSMLPQYKFVDINLFEPQLPSPAHLVKSLLPATKSHTN